MAEHRLKKCPFCGCLAWLHVHGMAPGFGQSHGYRVECEGNCHAMTCYWHTEQEAIDAWNARVNTPFKALAAALIVLLILGIAYKATAEPEPLTCPAPVDEVDCYDLGPGVYICTDPVDLPTYSI